MNSHRDKLLNDVLFFLYALFIFGSTFSIALAQSSFGLALALFLFIAIYKKCNPFQSALKWFYISVALYILWMAVASIVGDTPIRSLRIMKEEWLFAIVPVGVYLMRKEGYRKKLILAFVLGVGIFSVYGILQHFTGVYWTKKVPPNVAPDFGYIVKGTFPHSMTFGNYYATAAAFVSTYTLVQWKKMTDPGRLLFGLVSSFAILVTLFSYSRGSIIALTLGLLTLGFILGRRKAAYAAGVFIAIALAALIAFPGLFVRMQQNLQREFNANDEKGRTFIWSTSMKIAEENPVFGVGQGNFHDAYKRLRPADVPGTKNQVHAHNDQINIAAIAGYPGALFFLGIWAAVFVYCWRGWWLANKRGVDGSYFAAGLIGAVTFFFSSITEATFADEEVRQMLMFVWAVGLWQILYPQSKIEGNPEQASTVKALDNGPDLKLNE